MLELTRKPGQAIYINDSVKVTVLGISRGVVRIGIAAPSSVAVHREEVYERIQLERQAKEERP